MSKLEMLNNGSFRSDALSFRSGTPTSKSPDLQLANLRKPLPPTSRQLGFAVKPRCKTVFGNQSNYIKTKLAVCILRLYNLCFSAIFVKNSFAVKYCYNWHTQTTRWDSKLKTIREVHTLEKWQERKECYGCKILTSKHQKRRLMLLISKYLCKQCFWSNRLTLKLTQLESINWQWQ